MQNACNSMITNAQTEQISYILHDILAMRVNLHPCTSYDYDYATLN